jgi:hypothetical protein
MPKHWTLVEYSDGRPPEVFRAERFGAEDLQNWSSYWYFASNDKKEPHLCWVMVRRLQDLPADFLSLYTLTAPMSIPSHSSFVLHMDEKDKPMMLQAQGVTVHGHMEYCTIPFERRHVKI